MVQGLQPDWSLSASVGTFPVDLTKTRLQVQGQSIDARFREIKYRGMFHALFRIYKEEGILALYSGIAPALLRQASYGTIKIGIYQSLKRLFVDRLEDETLLINMICGVVSGVISSTLANPTDVLKIRMQAQGSLFQGGMIGSFIDIYQQEGTRGLWRTNAHERGGEDRTGRKRLSRGRVLQAGDSAQPGGGPHGAASCHCGWGRAASLRHHQEAPDPLWIDGGHDPRPLCFQFYVRAGWSPGLQPSGRGADADDEPEGHSGERGALQRHAGWPVKDVEERGLLCPLQRVLAQLAPAWPLEHHFFYHL
nr:brain mitochondrial carrier protein 1 isoform X1 [Pelodiscus sinensis]|eukprot:XP_006118157.1 brain mitochondrial carrier protein 1 isoform X1 [Pelodiscus sinensis]